MNDSGLFVVCPSCSSEVSPYVTECPYCGNRLRKRAPDLKKQRAADEKAERREAKRRERLRAQYEGGPAPGAWLQRPEGRPIATIVLIAISVLASVLATADLGGISRWAAEQLVFVGSPEGQPWTLVTSPLLQYSFGYGFVCLFIAAVFGAGIEQRFGSVALVLVWVISGALGVLAEWLIAPLPRTYGAYAIAVGLYLTWILAVGLKAERRSFDTLGLGAVAAVLCLLPLATADARVATLIGGIVGGVVCGAALGRVAERG